MLKSVSGILFILLSNYLFAQIQFYGEIESIGTINSSSGDNYLYITSDETSIYLTREKHPENSHSFNDRGDIWVSSKDSTWSIPSLLPGNDEHMATPLGFNYDRTEFYFNKVWFEKGVYRGGVFAFVGKNLKKEIPIDVPFFKNISPLQTGNLSHDGRHLLISLENSSGYGVDDLYASHLQSDGKWSSPKNLGHIINTRFQEITPFLAADSKTLIFASNGRDGEGSFDLYITTRLDDTWQNWSQPMNLSEVNGSGSETSMVFSNDATYAYFVSTQNSDGYGDVKRIKIKADIQTVEPVVKIEEMVGLEDTIQVADDSPEHEESQKEIRFEFKDAKSKESLLTNVLLAKNTITQNEDSLKLFPGGALKNLIITINEGEVYDFEFKSKGYLSEELRIGWEEVKEAGETRTILLEPLESGNTITLKNVLFYRGTANFIEGSERELDLIFEMMNENPEINIFLKGHTDNVGNPMLNIQLSQERIRSVKEYLVAKGVNNLRVSGKGYGGSEPIASNENELTRKLNRRVEFVISRD